MSAVLAIMNREIKSFTQTFSFYLLLAFFWGVTGYFYLSNLSFFSLHCFQAAVRPGTVPSGLNLVEWVLSPFLANVSVLLLLMVPILSSRCFSDERRQGTLELLYTYPVTEFQILAGKYLALLYFVLILILPTGLYFPLAMPVKAYFEPQAVVTGYAGLFLVGATFSALGLFVSTLTENHVVSAGIVFALLLFFWIVGWVAEWANPFWAAFFSELSLVEHFRDFTKGIIDTRDLIFFLLMIFYFLFAALSVMEVRTWKK